MKAFELNLKNLWKQRFDRFAKESIGYWQYAVRSNFLLFLLLVVIVTSYYYTKTLQRLPTNYPFIWIVELLLAPLLVLSPIRTLLRDADRMFLLPTELKLGAYFRGGFVYSLIVQSFFTFIALIALWPLYRHCAGEATQSFLLVLLFLILIKTANLLGAWQESRFVYRNTRRATSLCRWIATLLIIWTLFLHSALIAGGVALLCICIWFAATRSINQYTVGWDYLIEKEKQLQARLYGFFNWFVDVPQLPAQIRHRSWISGITARLPFQQASTYIYIYTKTLLRTELFAILLRITLIAGLAIYVLSDDAAKAVVLLVTLLVSTIQLSTLGQAHRYTFWFEMYPLDKNRRAGSLAKLIWTTLAVQTCLLTIPLLFTAALIYVLVPLLSLALCTYICGVVLRRKFQNL
ncbi:ABC transporter permease [Paenibacillus eucommiae]|uniref:ABC-2 type transport system permease protein n=1 Tax=Paenibacillus eucommiae TaxID=1355755 RepID=A0ABS4JAA9_9BACL|nr:ABC transporter permease [Paenibacillus eucommiae]MBP1996190.1 ABC-2 type transport system permease protein [Paenibacillus eucommiae]